MNLVLFICISGRVLGANDHLLIIDTGFNDSYAYNNFLALAKSVGFKAEVKNFLQISSDSIDSYGCIMVNLDGSFVGDYIKNKETIEKASPITKKILSMLSLLSKKKNRLLGFMLPSKMGTTIKNSCQNIYELTLPHDAHDKAIKNSLCSFLQELMQSDSKRSVRYHTTLLTKHEKHENCAECTAKLKIANAIDETTNTIIAGHLPFHRFHSLPPLAWYCTNPTTGKHFFVTKASLMLFSDIGENFIYNPLEFPLRFERLKELQQLLYELYRVCVVGKFSKFCQMPSLVMPPIFSKKYLLDAKKKLRSQRSTRVDKSLYDWVERDLIWCGWGSIDSYDKESAVKTLIDSKFNLIWFQMNPECYLAKNGYRKKEEDDFFKRISFITERLQKASTTQPIPHFFVGTEITSNYLRCPVKNPAIDCYGNVYTKIPSPLDFDNFWKPELLDVIDQLALKWPSISHGIPLAGIFFDLEMYHAQDQTGHYLSCMDFSDIAWQTFCAAHHNKKCIKIVSIHERCAYLLQNHLFDYYFATLQKKAYEIGCAIKDHMAKKLPNALIAIYDLHLPHTWFYKGLLAGLSSQKRPIILATFNNDFYRHYPWLLKNGIYAYHLPALLLSKFKTVEDFNLINHVAKFHDGAWFNRISRLEESLDSKGSSWNFNVEVSPLSKDVFIREMNKKILEMQSSMHSTY